MQLGQHFDPLEIGRLNKEFNRNHICMGTGLKCGFKKEYMYLARLFLSQYHANSASGFDDVNRRKHAPKHEQTGVKFEIIF